MRRTLHAAIAMSAVAIWSPRIADADDDGDTTTHGEMALFEAAVALAIPTAYYWQTKEHQAIDWTIGTDWESWKTKLTTTEWLKFDTNPFHVNAIRHPVAGVIDYHILRTNGFGGAAAFGFAALKGAFWEYFIEYREDPSINDMVFNPWGGIAIGEPMYRFGQLWRGETLSLADRTRTAMLSPFDTFHDTYRKGRWRRPAWWRSIELSIGPEVRHVEGINRDQMTAAADLDLVADPAFGDGVEHDTDLRIGTWSRLRFDVRLTDSRDSAHPLGTHLESATSVFGKLHQDADGNTGMVALGTAFSYRTDPLLVDEDRLAIAHLLGPQLSLSRHASRYDVRWDAALYVDFGLIQALVFRDRSPFPPPPPYYTSLQSDGYIDALGITATSRWRASSGPWHLDAELIAHELHQVDGFDRDPEGTGSGSSTRLAETTTPSPITAFGIVERRLFVRGRVGYRRGHRGIAAIVDGAVRRSRWEAGGQGRDVRDLSGGLVFELVY